MADLASLGTYHDIDAAISALRYHQNPDGEDRDEANEELPPVQHLHLSCCDIDNNDVARISDAITDSPDAAQVIASVNLGWNDILGDSIYSLVHSLLPLSGLLKLDLNYNSIGDDGARHVAQLIQADGSLTFLDLVKNSINEEGVQVIAQALGQNRSLKALHLGMNNIADEGLMHLAGALTTNDTLLTLDVETNRIGPQGVEEFAEVLKEMNRTLTAINLQDNEIGDRGAVSLASMLESSESLGMVDIRSNQITITGCEALAAALRKCVVPNLNLDLRSNTVMNADVNSQLQELSNSDSQIYIQWDYSPESVTETGTNQPAHEVESPDYCPESETCLADQMQVERMLGIIEDQADIAFDNATWYLTKQPELAKLMWECAHSDGSDSAMMRCLEICHNLLQHSITQQAEIFPAMIVDTCLSELGYFCQVLQRPPSAGPVALHTTFGTVPERFGSLRLCVVDLVCDLLQAPDKEVVESICKARVLQIILDHFFAYEWNNLLHCSVLQILSAGLNGESTQEGQQIVIKHIFAPASAGGCGLLQRMLDVYDTKCPRPDSQVAQTESPMQEGELVDGTVLEKQLVAASLTCGYMNAIIDTTIMLSESPHFFVEDLESEELTERWGDFIQTVLSQLKPIMGECLGGGIPPQSAAPPCSQM